MITSLKHPSLFFSIFWFKLPKIGTYPQLKFKRAKDMHTYLRLFPYPRGSPSNYDNLLFTHPSLITSFNTCMPQSLSISFSH
ncbi:hypothetical protein AMTRI_Chr04g184760 [Amborella trichopoda]